MSEVSNTHPISAGSAAQDTFAQLRAQVTNLSPGLYLVATPIGNLRDITLRALDVLKSADLILAEDTRTSRKLMQAYGLKTRLSAYHDHNAAKRVPNLVKYISEGQVIALISDAGTPLVSDPGYKLARGCIEAGLPVYAVPGASAVLTALVSAGLPSDKFMFAGFLPPKTSARKTSLETLKTVPSTLIFYESARRLPSMLGDIRAVLGNRAVVIARELTKKYEEVLRGSADEMLAQLSDTVLRGEIVVLVGPPKQNEQWDEAQIESALKVRVPEIGMKQASAEIASLSGHKKRDIYQRALKLKND